VKTWPLLAVALGAFVPFAAMQVPPVSAGLVIDRDTRPDSVLQSTLERVDGALREKLGVPADAVAVGLVDLRTARVAWLRPDAGDYAASVPKIGILLAWFGPIPRPRRR
jgi:hypothetical protein